MDSLFARDHRPLAERLRPTQLSEVVGQKHLKVRNGLLEAVQRTGQVGSLVLHGPPGVGKTTIARLLARATGMTFHAMSATSAGKAELTAVVRQAEADAALGKRTMLFLDEGHRWSKAQQDALLPHLESGLLTLVTASTEHPSYAMVGAALSRMQVVELKALEPEDLAQLLERAEALMGSPLPLTPEARELLIRSSGGDGRSLLTRAEAVWRAQPAEPITAEELPGVVQARAASGDISEGYDLLSALHKSLRASDPDASLYWAARLLDAGEDPRVIMRRLCAMAPEDIGLADPQAMVQALTAWQIVERVGLPEGRLAMSQAIIYLALSPKSNAAYAAINQAIELARQTRHLPPPATMQVAATGLQRAQGRGQDYAYDHDYPGAFSGQQRLPDALVGTTLYEPSERGWEAVHLRPRVDKWRLLRAQGGRQPVTDAGLCPVEQRAADRQTSKSQSQAPQSQAHQSQPPQSQAPQPQAPQDSPQIQPDKKKQSAKTRKTSAKSPTAEPANKPADKKEPRE